MKKRNFKKCPTARGKDKMKNRKIEILTDRKRKHETLTGGIFYCRDSAGFSVSTSNKLLCNLTGQCFEIGNKNIPPNR